MPSISHSSRAPRAAIAAAIARRWSRRAEVLPPASPPVTPDVAEALATRDARDELVNPFVPAPDAVPVDTTGRDPDDVLRQALAIARDRLDASGE